MATGADETANYDRIGAPMREFKPTDQDGPHAGTWKIKEVSTYLNSIGVEVGDHTIWRALNNKARRLEQFPGAYQGKDYHKTWHVPIAEAKVWRPQPSGKYFVAKRIWKQPHQTLDV